MKKYTALLLALSMLAGVFAFSGCSESDEQSGGETSQEASSESSADASQTSENTVSDISATESKPDISSEKLAQLNNFISKYNNIPDFNVKSEKIDAASISKNKSISFVPDNSNDVFTQLVTKQFVTATKSAGFKNVYSDKSDGTPASYNAALSKAVEKNSNIAVMYGDINKDSVATQIETTQANGIKVLSAGYVGKDTKDHYVDYTIPIDYQLCGKLMADWTITRKKGKVNALALNNSDSTLSTSIYEGFADEFKKYITQGYCTVLSGSAIETGNGLSTKIKQAIDKDPNLNYIVVLDETMINDAISAVEQSGKKIHIIATGGGTSAFTAAENGKIDMLVAQSYEWIAYSMVDYSLRVLGGKKLPDIQSVPVRVVNKASIKSDLEKTEYTDIDGFYEICFGANFVTGYRSLWGLS